MLLYGTQSTRTIVKSVVYILILGLEMPQASHDNYKLPVTARALREPLPAWTASYAQCAPSSVHQS